MIVVTGAIVTKWGYYVREFNLSTLFLSCSVAYWSQQVPYMIAGQTICVIGADLITRLDLTSTTVTWASYLVITGVGMGMSMQLPCTALQVVLKYGTQP